VQMVHLSAGPGNLHAVSPGCRAQAEGQDQFALGEISAAVQILILGVVADPEAHGGADAVAGGFCAHQLDSEAVVCAAGVAEERGGSSVGGHQDVGVAVIIYVRESCAAAEAGRAEIGAEFEGYIFELSSAAVAEQVRGLAV